jgi:hypothetical protein
VIVGGDHDRQADLRRFVRRFGAEIATDRHVKKSYCLLDSRNLNPARLPISPHPHFVYFPTSLASV